MLQTNQMNYFKESCFCGSENIFGECCEPYIKGTQKAETAEALMRSRYSAYAIHEADYLVATTHISQRKFHSKREILNWAINNQWQKLEIIKVTENTVEFKAYFLDANLQNQTHHELSNFITENGSWYYVDGIYF